jgi:hypothetical protein
LKGRRFGEYYNCHLHGGDGKKAETTAKTRLSNNSNIVSVVNYNSMKACWRGQEILTSALDGDT